MRIILFVFFVVLNYLSIFTFAEQLSKKRLKIALIVLYLVLLCIAMAVHTWFLDNTLFSTAARNIIFCTYASLMVSIVISFANRIFPALTSTVISFHRKHNAVHINRHPIKFLIDNQHRIIKVISSLMLLGAVMGMYGLWFGEK